MIVNLDRKKLEETFAETIDPNLLFEENDDDVDKDVGATVHDHVHDHHHPILD
ncbi:MAG TPA: hypothetical protein VFI24_08515 [Pyrinomonadaceae bacterium]|nr:hypothetical protein [Pyrinomonadaceae bacterium]